jgi:hypothetical protein
MVQKIAGAPFAHPLPQHMEDQSTQVCDDDFYDAVSASSSEEEDDADTYVTAIEDVIETEEEREQIENDILKFIADFFEEHILHMSSPDFYLELVETIMETFFSEEADHYDTVYEWVEDLVEEYYSWGIFPKRSRPATTTNDSTPESSSSLMEKIDFLRRIVQPDQRTAEWFEFRHNCITASAVGKIFASEAQRNSLIYEKCKPLQFRESDGGGLPNFDSPTEWGKKYEPLSKMIYEYIFQTTVGEFGCIPHPTCKCLAASPDGINVDPKSKRLGWLVEFKNIVNRMITGIPLILYWIQMQIQMEVCDLDRCDFFETRFLEFPDADAFWNAVDSDTTPQYLGIMLLFLDASYQNYRYEIMPIDMSLEFDTVLMWVESAQHRFRSQGFRLYQTIYWYLDEYSCVLVDRNRMWFAAAKPVIEETWATIERERIHGCEHRAPKKRPPPSGQQLEARSKAALAQLFASADEDCLVEAIESDKSVNELIQSLTKKN